MKAVTPEIMRKLDADTIASGARTGIELMRDAGRGAAERILRTFHDTSPAAVLAGKGNNGGDGFVIAAELVKVRPVRIFCTVRADALRGDALQAFSEMPSELRESVRSSLRPEDLSGCGLAVDALLGTGISGEVRSPEKEWIEILNASGLPVVSIDIPSGLNAADGTVPGGAVVSDLTLTFALPKTGLLRNDGPKYSRRIEVVPIGIPPDLLASAPEAMCTTHISDIRPFFAREETGVYKNLRGHVLILGGSAWYPAAPLISAEAALRTGAGLVTAAIPGGVEPLCSVPKGLIIRRLRSFNGFFDSESSSGLEEILPKITAVAIGPGLSTGPGPAAFLRKILPLFSVPVLLDADALNLVAENPDLLGSLRKLPSLVLTPHAGELHRLMRGFGLTERSPDEDARTLSSFTGAVVVRKGPFSAVAAPDGTICYNLSGCSALATAGSGDILTGISSALLGRGLPAADAARAGVFLHGLCGNLAAPPPFSGRGVTADSLLKFIGAALRRISPFA